MLHHHQRIGKRVTRASPSRARSTVGGAVLFLVGAAGCNLLVGISDLNPPGEDGGYDASLDGAAPDTSPADGATLDARADAACRGPDAGAPPSCACPGPGIDSCGGAGDCCASLSVPKGSFARVGNKSYPATVSAFRLDAYEITVARFRAFVSAVVSGYAPAAGDGKHTHIDSGEGLETGDGGHETGWDLSWTLPMTKSAWDTALGCDANFATWTSLPGANESKPINCETWFEAAAFCIWDGGFLPSEAESDYAAEGGNAQRTYPWGDAGPGPDALLAAYGCYYGNPSGMCSGVINLAPVGSIPAGNGQWGQSDLGGNVWEWVLDWIGTPLNPCADCAQTSVVTTRVIRGGGFANSSVGLEHTTRGNQPPSTRSKDFGSRCARTP